MTEYDFSMEGYTKHMERMNKVGQWVDLTNQFPPADPRTAATPGTTIMAPLPLVEHERDFPEDSDDSDDDSYRESRRDREIRRDRDRRDRKGRGSPISGKGRRRDRDRDRPSTSHALSRPPPTRSHTAPIRDRAINLRRESSSTSAGTYDQRHSGSSHDRAPAGRATASQPPYPNSYPIYEPTPKYSGPYPYTPYYPDEQLRPHTSHAHQHHRHPSLPGPAPLPPPPTPAPHTRQRQTRSHSISATVQPHIQTYIHPPPNTTPYGQPYPTAPLHAGLHAQTLRPPLTGTPPVYPFRPTLSSPPKTQHATWHHHQQPPPPVRSQTHPHAHALQQPQPRRFKAIPPEPLLLPPVGMQYIQGQNQGPPVIPQEVSSGSGGMSPTKVPSFPFPTSHSLKKKTMHICSLPRFSNACFTTSRGPKHLLLRLRLRLLRRRRRTVVGGTLRRRTKIKTKRVQKAQRVRGALEERERIARAVQAILGVQGRVRGRRHVGRGRRGTRGMMMSLCMREAGVGVGIGTGMGRSGSGLMETGNMRGRGRGKRRGDGDGGSAVDDLFFFLFNSVLCSQFFSPPLVFLLHTSMRGYVHAIYILKSTYFIYRSRDTTYIPPLCNVLRDLFCNVNLLEVARRVGFEPWSACG